MSIYILSGKPGAGKTLAAIDMMYRLKAQGRRVIANFHTLGGLSEFMLWDEMQKQSNCVIFIDEAHFWFPSRAWKDTGSVELARFQQHRKSGQDLVCVTQFPKQLDIGIRSLAVEIMEVTRCGNLAWLRKYDASTFNFETGDRSKHYGSRFIWLSDRLKKAYFTEEIVGERNGEGYAFGDNASIEGVDREVHYRLDFPEIARTLYLRESDPRLMKLAYSAQTCERYYWDAILGAFTPIVPVVKARELDGITITPPAEVRVTAEVSQAKKPGLLARLTGL